MLLPSGLHGPWWEIYSNSNWCCPVVIHCISLAAFKIFLCLSQHFDEDVPGHRFMFIMFWLCWAPWIYRFISFAKLEIFHSLFKKFSTPFAIIPQVPEILFIIYPIPPPTYCSGWIICIDVFNFTDTFLCHLFWDEKVSHLRPCGEFL